VFVAGEAAGDAGDFRLLDGAAVGGGAAAEGGVVVAADDLSGFVGDGGDGAEGSSRRYSRRSSSVWSS
jgi:hypothetical protein